MSPRKSRTVSSRSRNASKSRPRSRTAPSRMGTKSVNRKARRKKSSSQSRLRGVMQPILQVSWRRVAIATLSAVGACAVGTSVGFAGHLFYEKVVTSESFAVESIKLEGLERADGETVRTLAGVQNGENIFTLNLDDVKRGVASHPWVSSVEVSRVLPRTIKVQVQEYQPILMVALGALYYIDSSGAIVKRYTPGESENLPVVTGLTRDDFENDELRTRTRLRQIISFLKDYSLESKGAAQKIEELHVDPVMGLTLVPAGDRRRVRMGHAPWRQKIRQWERMKNDSGVQELLVKEVILGGARRPERVVMRLTGSNTANSGGAL